MTECVCQRAHALRARAVSQLPSLLSSPRDHTAAPRDVSSHFHGPWEPGSYFSDSSDQALSHVAAQLAQGRKHAKWLRQVGRATPRHGRGARASGWQLQPQPAG